MILDGKVVKAHQTELLKSKIDNLKSKPSFVVITVGDDMASNVYVKNKIKFANELNINAEHKVFNDDTSQDEIINYINELNSDQSIDGIILQLPISKGLDANEIASYIDSKKDLDGFSYENIAKEFLNDDSGLFACTVEGIFNILEYYNLDVAGKNVVIAGRSNIVGKPLAIRMINSGATVTVCNSKTPNIKYLIDQADIFISAIGVAKFYTKEYFIDNKDIIIIDVGMNRDENNKLCGDVDFHEVKDNVAAITPVPGGVGLLTVVNVIKNVVKAHENKKL